MKKFFFILFTFPITISAFTQKDFEGVIVYRNNVTSKVTGINSSSWKKILLLGDTVSIAVKKGNFRQSSTMDDLYILPEKQKVFIKFKKIDTLYYINFSADTSTVLAVHTSAEEKRIAGYNCKSLSVQTFRTVFKYYYSASIYQNPVYNQNYKINHEDIFSRQTSSLYLGIDEDNAEYHLMQTAMHVQEKPVGDSIFELPNFPEKPFSIYAYITFPEFAGKNGWIKYIQSKIDPSVADKYLKIGHKKDMASANVLVSFIVTETGSISNVIVENRNEVTAKLAAEAAKLVSNSPRWHPATVLGEPISFRLTQPISFQISKQ